MIRRAIFAAVIATMSGGAASAAPQRDSAAAYHYSPEESDRAFTEYSECLIGSRSGQQDALKFLRLIPDTPQWGAVGRTLTRPDCLRGIGRVKMRFNLTTLRPALFAALYRRRFGRFEPFDFANDPPLSVSSIFQGSVADFPPATYAQLSFGNCVVRRDAVAVHRLLMARPWTKEENLALPAVSRAMGGCLNKGETARFGRSAVRGIVAEAIYHLSSLRLAGSPLANEIPTGKN